MNIPKDLRYTRTHEWVKMDGEEATIGITDHAQTELGDVVYVELPPVGLKLQADEVFGTVESVKAVSDLYAPMAGEVVETNSELNSKTDVVNSDPYGEGWMIRLKVAEPTVAEKLLTADEYEAFITEGEQ
jgi:glycine cleavage system H protein